MILLPKKTMPRIETPIYLIESLVRKNVPKYIFK